MTPRIRLTPLVVAVWLSACSGGDDGDGNDGDDSRWRPGTCEELADHFVETCPGRDRPTEIENCEYSLSYFAPMGCATEWGLFVGCAADAEIVCDTGEAVGCDSHPSDPAYACDRAFFDRIGCGRLPDDSLCPAGQFYFLCTGDAIPTGCTSTPPEPLTANYVCCPPFPD